MYTLVRRFIKTGIAFLCLGLGLGFWMLVRRELLGVWPSPYLISAHTHAVFVGFVMFMILGVALWLFPRPSRGDERYRPALVEVAYWLLLTGTIGRFVGEASQAWVSFSFLGWIVVLGGMAQIAGFGVYFWTMWTRIRPAGSHLREAAGEKF